MITQAKFISKTKDIKKLLNQIGIMMVGRIQGAFDKQRRGNFIWKERAVPNKMGIISDLNSSSTVKSRRFQPRPALRDTSTLYKSISPSQPKSAFKIIEGEKSVIVGSNLEYASTLQTGGETKPLTIGGAFRKNLAKFLKTSMGKRYKDKLGWMFSLKVGSKVSVKVPPRPFAILIKEDLTDINNLIESYYKN